MISSGLRRTDGSIVEGTTGSFNTTVNNQSMIRRLPPNVQIGSGPIKGGFFNNDGTAFTGPNPLLNSKYDPTTLYEGGRRPPSFFDPSNQGIATIGQLGDQRLPPGRGPGGVTLRPGAPTQEKKFSQIGQLPNGTGTQMPLGGFPIPNVSSVNSNNTQGIGSFFDNENQQNNFSYINNNNNNQDFGQYLNSYINNSINQRMQSIFKGIMSLFQ